MLSFSGSFQRGYRSHQGLLYVRSVFNPSPQVVKGPCPTQVFRRPPPGGGRQLNLDPEWFFAVVSYSRKSVGLRRLRHAQIIGGFFDNTVFFYSGYYLVLLEPVFIISGVALDQAILFYFSAPSVCKLQVFSLPPPGPFGGHPTLPGALLRRDTRQPWARRVGGHTALRGRGTPTKA